MWVTLAMAAMKAGNKGGTSGGAPLRGGSNYGGNQNIGSYESTQDKLIKYGLVSVSVIIAIYVYRK